MNKILLLYPESFMQVMEAAILHVPSWLLYRGEGWKSSLVEMVAALAYNYIL